MQAGRLSSAWHLGAGMAGGDRPRQSGSAVVCAAAQPRVMGRPGDALGAAAGQGRRWQTRARAPPQARTDRVSGGPVTASNDRASSDSVTPLRAGAGEISQTTSLTASLGHVLGLYVNEL